MVAWCGLLLVVVLGLQQWRFAGTVGWGELFVMLMVVVGPPRVHRRAGANPRDSGDAPRAGAGSVAVRRPPPVCRGFRG